MIRGCDYSTSHPSLAGLKRDGRQFVILYLNRFGGDPDNKAVTAREAQAIKAAGMNLVLNWETAGDRSGGSDVGINHAMHALDAARALGVPVRAIYFSDEQETGSARLSIDYMRGVKAVLDPARVRAGYYSRDRVRAIKDALPDVLTWQACFECTESVFDSRVAIRQTRGTHDFAGGQIDDDVAMVDDYGQCWREDDMTPDEVKELVNHMLSSQRWARFAMGVWKEAGDDVQGADQAETKGEEFAKKAVAPPPHSP